MMDHYSAFKMILIKASLNMRESTFAIGEEYVVRLCALTSSGLLLSHIPGSLADNLKDKYRKEKGK